MKRAYRNGLLIVVVATVLAGMGGWMARTAQAQATRIDPGSVEALLREFATAIQNNDLNTALKCFATEEDVKGLFADEVIGQMATNIQSRAKLAFPEFVAAVKEFGKCDMFEAGPGQPMIIPKEQRRNIVEIQVFENGYVSFAKDANYLIELRIRVGGIIKGSKNRWVFTNLTTRQEFFGRGG